MNPLDRLSEYLGIIERRVRWLTLSRGAAATAAAALVLTLVAVLAANYFAFSNSSVLGARVFLFLGLAFALAAALIVPVIRLNRRRAARTAERKCPQFEERLLTFSERVEQNPSDPFLELLAADTLSVAEQAEPKEIAERHGFSVSLPPPLSPPWCCSGWPPPAPVSWGMARRCCGDGCRRAA